MFIKSGLSSGGLFIRWYRELISKYHVSECEALKP